MGCVLGLLAPLAGAQTLPEGQAGSAWFTDAAAALQRKLDTGGIAGQGAGQDGGQPIGRPKNVILFVGSGMGVSTLTAARILDGQRRGGSGEENLLPFERFPHTALVKTYSVDAQGADPAGSATAIMSGVKANAGTLGMDADAVRGDCASTDGNRLISALELAELKGIATGIVSTGSLTDALPAAGYANVVEQDWEDDASVPADAAGCEDIASQFVSFGERVLARHDRAIDGIELAFGGGRQHFLPNEASVDTTDADTTAEGLRADGRNLVDEWQLAYPDGSVVTDSAGFASVDSLPVLGLFDAAQMHYEADRANDRAGEPSLEQMTRRAVELLATDPQGYLLVVEAARIGDAHAAGSAASALDETLSLARAVSAARDASDPADTLILVTADHAHALTISGYPRRGNPILGKIVAEGKVDPALASDGLPQTTLGYPNGRGFRDLGAQTDADASYETPPLGGRRDLSAVDTTSAGFHQETLVPLEATAAGGEDVTLHASGPGASRVNGVIEQNVVFHIVERALQLFDLPSAELTP